MIAPSVKNRFEKTSKEVIVAKFKYNPSIDVEGPKKKSLTKDDNRIEI